MGFFPGIFVLGKLGLGALVGYGAQSLPFGSTFGESQLLWVLRGVWFYDFVSVVTIITFGMYLPEEVSEVISLAVTCVVGTTAFVWGVIWSYREFHDSPKMIFKFLVAPNL